MPSSARCCVLFLFLSASAAAAQADHSRPPDFRLSSVDRFRPVPAPPDGFVAAASIGERIRFGVGRFGVADRPRPRSHVEPVPQPTDVRRRHRGTAAIGFSLSF